MKELRRSLKMNGGQWVAARSADEADAVVNILVNEKAKKLVLFVVFTDRRKDPRIYLCAIARAMEFCDFASFDVFLYGLDAQRKNWFGQMLGKFAGGIKSSGLGQTFTGINPILSELRGYEIEINQIFLDQIDQSIKLIYMKDR